MEQKQNGGRHTAVTLGEVTDPKVWLTAADCILHGNSQTAVCPYCGPNRCKVKLPAAPTI